MSHAAGEPAYGFHLLRMAQLQLELSVIGNVQPCPNDLDRHAGIIAADSSFLAQPAIPAILMTKAVLVCAVGFQCLTSLPIQSGSVIGVHALGPPIGRIRCGNVVAEYRGDIVADPFEGRAVGAGETKLENDGAAGGDDALQAQLRGEHQLGGPLALGDVFGEDDARRSPFEYQHLRLDFHVFGYAGLRAMAPHFIVDAARSEFGNLLPKRRHKFRRTDALNRHGEELFARKAIELHRRIVHGEKGKCLEIIDPHRLRIRIKDRPIPSLRCPELAHAVFERDAGIRDARRHPVERHSDRTNFVGAADINVVSVITAAHRFGRICEGRQWPGERAAEHPRPERREQHERDISGDEFRQHAPHRREDSGQGKLHNNRPWGVTKRRHFGEYGSGVASLVLDHSVRILPIDWRSSGQPDEVGPDVTATIPQYDMGVKTDHGDHRIRRTVCVGDAAAVHDISRWSDILPDPGNDRKVGLAGLQPNPPHRGLLRPS